MKIWTRRQGNTVIKLGQTLIVDARGFNLEVVNRVGSGAFVTLFKYMGNGILESYKF